MDQGFFSLSPPVGVLSLHPQADPIVAPSSNNNSISGDNGSFHDSPWINRAAADRRMSGERSPGVIQRSPDFGPQMMLGNMSPPMQPLPQAQMATLFAQSPILQSQPPPQMFLSAPPPFMMSSSAPAHGGFGAMPWRNDIMSDMHILGEPDAGREFSFDDDASSSHTGFSGGTPGGGLNAFNNNNNNMNNMNNNGNGNGMNNNNGLLRSASTDSTNYDDLFSSIGGLELDDPEGVNISNINGNPIMGNNNNNMNNNGGFNMPPTGGFSMHPSMMGMGGDGSPIPNGMGGGGGGVAHEHPGRAVLVRNIAPNVEDAELMTLFEQFGSVRSLYTHFKHRGFIIVLFNDIRHAQTAVWHLQGRMVRRRSLDLHFSIPKSLKEQMSERDRELCHGTLVVFNLDPATTNEDLHRVFSHSGEVKEIRETPNKKHHKFVEFFDIRAAEIALRTLNKTELRGKKIKIEASRPGSSNKSAGNEGDEHRHDYRSLSPGNMDLNNSPPPLLSEISSPTFLRSIGIDPRISAAIADGRMGAWAQPPPMAGRISVSAPAEGSGFGLHQMTPGMMMGMDDGSRGGGVGGPNRDKRREKSQESHSFALDIDAVRAGFDSRSTLMIKNIPNKYSQRMLLAAVDRIVLPGSYDFFYLPIDFKNKCNVGYAFINFVSTHHIPDFVAAFHRHTWEKFNSDKICEVTYARIQGKHALIQHFQNSSLMAEERKCRPLIFHTDGAHKGEQEPFPIGPNARRRLSSDRPLGLPSQGGVGMGMAMGGGVGGVGIISSGSSTPDRQQLPPTHRPRSGSASSASPSLGAMMTPPLGPLPLQPRI